eukprot:9035956-Pyramimonas_sp.AAC.1
MVLAATRASFGARLPQWRARAALPSSRWAQQLATSAQSKRIVSTSKFARLPLHAYPFGRPIRGNCRRTAPCGTGAS